jgi:hypothetical protein
MLWSPAQHLYKPLLENIGIYFVLQQVSEQVTLAANAVFLFPTS